MYLQLSVVPWCFCLHSSLSVCSNLLPFHQGGGFSTSRFFPDHMRKQLDVRQKISDGVVNSVSSVAGFANM